MKNPVLTYSNEKHDFYVGESYPLRFWDSYDSSNGKSEPIYQIVPKGTTPSNTGGYFSPEYILAVKGYFKPGNKLSVETAFGCKI